MVRRRKGEDVPGRAADQVADLLASGDAGQHPARRASATRAPGTDRPLRTLNAALERAAEVEKKTYRESLQKNVERIRMSQRLATIATDSWQEFSPEASRPQTADPVLLKAIYKEMEFNSLLKELGPSEDTRERQYSVISSGDELLAWLAEAQGAPGAVAILYGGSGSSPWTPSVFPGVPARRTPHRAFRRLAPWLEDASAVKIACDVKGPCSNWRSRIEGAVSITM
jgi:DNA polymerase-1